MKGSPVFRSSWLNGLNRVYIWKGRSGGGVEEGLDLQLSAMNFGINSLQLGACVEAAADLSGLG